MSRYGTVNGGTANARSFVAQGADPDALGQSILAALIANASVQPPLVDPVITSISMTGAGDGHQFFFEVEFAAAANVDGGLDLAGLKLLLASTAADLQKQIVAFQSAAPIADVQLAGSSKGRRVMAAIVSGTVRGSQTELLSRVDLSVNDAYVEGPYTRTPILHAQPGGNVLGGFNGGGLGSKSILGFRTVLGQPISGMPLSQLKTLQYTWRDLSPPTSVVPFTDAYVNFVVDMLGNGTQYNIFVIDPQFDASLVNNTTVVNPDGTSTTTFDAATQCPVIITPPVVTPSAGPHVLGQQQLQNGGRDRCVPERSASRG